MRTHIMKTNHVLILGAFVLSIVPAAATAEAAIEALMPDDLLAAMRRHIDPEKISIFRVGDFANKLAR